MLTKCELCGKELDWKNRELSPCASCRKDLALLVPKNMLNGWPRMHACPRCGDIHSEITALCITCRDRW